MANFLLMFEENSFQTFFHDIRVFIQGVEVTHDIIGTIAVTLSDRDGTNIASLTIDNALDKYVMTQHNVDGKFGVDESRIYDESPKQGIYNFKTRQTVKDSQADQREVVKKELRAALKLFHKQLGKGTKETNFEAERAASDDVVSNLDHQYLDSEKVRINTFNELVDEMLLMNKELGSSDAQEVVEASLKKRDRGYIHATNVIPFPSQSAQNLNPSDLKTGQRRWEFGLKSPVFHRNDPIVIFAHNPLTEEDEWMWAFTGFINRYPKQVDYVSGLSTFSLSCYCIRAVMQKMKVALNGVRGWAVPDLIFDDAGIFTQMNNPSNLTHKLAHASMEASTEYLITGQVTIDQANAGKLTLDGQVAGVGGFTKGEVYRYPAEGSTPKLSGLAVPEPSDRSDPNVRILENWHTLGLFGSKGRFLTSAEVDEIGRETKTGGKHDPTSKKVHYLLPREGTNVHNLVEFAVGTYSEQIVQSVPDHPGILGSPGLPVDHVPLWGHYDRISNVRLLARGLRAVCLGVPVRKAPD